MKRYFKNSIFRFALRLFAALALISAAYAEDTDQEKEITQKDLPAAVLTAFQNAYPKAKIEEVSTEMLDDTIFYEIVCEDGKTKRSVLYTADGGLYVIETVMRVKDLPEDVKTGVHSQFPNGKMKKAEQIAHGAEVTYEVVVKDGKKRWELVFDPNGKTLKTEDITGEKEED